MKQFTTKKTYSNDFYSHAKQACCCFCNTLSAIPQQIGNFLRQSKEEQTKEKIRMELVFLYPSEFYNIDDHENPINLSLKKTPDSDNSIKL